MIFKQGVVKLPEQILLGSTLGGASCDRGILSKKCEMAVLKSYSPRIDVFLNNLSPWPEGELTAEPSLKISELHDCHRCIGGTQAQ